VNTRDFFEAYKFLERRIEDRQRDAESLYVAAKGCNLQPKWTLEEYSENKLYVVFDCEEYCGRGCYCMYGMHTHSIPIAFFEYSDEELTAFIESEKLRLAAEAEANKLAAAEHAAREKKRKAAEEKQKKIEEAAAKEQKEREEYERLKGKYE
jgi:hypothetical protein